MIKIFGKDLYEDEKLEILFSELLWISGMKPFECVGTNNEVTLAMYYSYEKYEWKKLPYILQIFEEKVLPYFSLDKKIKEEKDLFKISDETIIPEKFKKIL
jgi:hypothetical protein